MIQPQKLLLQFHNFLFMKLLIISHIIINDYQEIINNRKLEDVMGSGVLQVFIISTILRFLYKIWVVVQRLVIHHRLKHNNSSIEIIAL
ncbi:hypothetical protein TI03_05145 [Achromatium sp. WMS1]|nr:hypothetical protein TI03_05145 [Achromatium sp. WMS1]